MKKYISKLHYLTQDLSNRSHFEQCVLACEAGANWIQYRCFSKSEEEMIAELHQIASVCDDWGATLIITDHYQLLDQVDAQGVHVENPGTGLADVRRIISDEKTLGASANTIEDIITIYKEGASDYIGCGPFSYTTTKPNNYPTLGISGYRSLLKEMTVRNIDIPVLAVGGIKTGDVSELMETGIYGIAVSSAVNLDENPQQVLRDIYKLIY